MKNFKKFFKIHFIKDFFVHSPARKCRYLEHLHLHGISSPCKIPLPVATRWNSWFDYTRRHLQYWSSFFQDELAKDQSNDTLKKITNNLFNPYEFGVISIYIHFISVHARQFIQDTNFFQQQNKPVFSFIERCLYHLNAFLQSNCDSSDFGSEIDLTIISHNFNPSDFYPIFCAAFEAALNKFNAHIPSHPACPLFYAAQIFDPKFILLGPLERKNLRQYRSIKELENPSDELLNEWAIYCGMQTDDLIGEIDLNEYWINIQDQLPIYNNILDSNRQNLSETSLKTLNMIYNSSSINYF